MEYDIKQVSKMTDISVDTVHHYVKKFRKYFKGLKRGKFNSLVFSDCDIELLISIRTMNKMENKTLKEIMTYFRECNENNLNNPQTIIKNDVCDNNENSDDDIINIQSSENTVFPIKKIENFEIMISDIKDEYKKIIENNENILGKTDDLKKMMNLLYTKLNSIENRQQKMLDDMNVTVWDKLKGFLLKPVRVPFLWKL